MATEVTRSLSEIDLELKKISASLRDASKETASLNKSLKLDPTNLKLAEERTRSLKDQVSLTEQKLALLKQRQSEMKALVDSGAVPVSQYQKLETQITQCESKVAVLNRQVKNTGSERLATLSSSLQGVSRIATAILASIAAIGIAFAKTGDEIAKASEKYSISAATYQYWRNIFDQTTGDSKGYPNTLVAITTLLGQVAKGSSKAATALATMGLTLNDLKGLNTQDALLKIISALQGIEDEDERLAVATALLGNAGSEVVMVASLSQQEIQNLNDTLEQSGIITDEEAQSAAALNDSFTNLQNQFKKVIVSLGSSLVPLFESLIQIGSALLPVISAIVQVFAVIPAPLQVILVFLLGILAALPKIIALVKAVNIALTVLGANPINLKFILIATAIALVIILLVQLAKWLGEIFGRKWNLDMDTSAAQNALNGTNDNLASQVSQTAEATPSQNNIVVNDYRNINITTEQNLDTDEIIEQINMRRVVVGGR